MVDADLSGYFDSIPHAELMKSVARRIVDGAMLHLIKMWLEAPVEETDERGRQASNYAQSRTRVGARRKGLRSVRCSAICICGGSCWAGRQLGHEKRLQAHIVNYADDFVICCRGQRRRSAGRDAGHDGEAEADGERDEDAGLSAAGRDVRFSGVHVRSVLLAEDGAGLSGHACRRRSGCSASARRSARDRPQYRPCWMQETVVGKLNRMLNGLGQLLLSGAGQQSLPSGGAACPQAAPSVAVRQAQSARAGRPGGFRTVTCTMCWVWSALQRGPRSFPWANA